MELTKTDIQNILACAKEPLKILTRLSNLKDLRDMLNRMASNQSFKQERYSYKTKSWSSCLKITFKQDGNIVWTFYIYDTGDKDKSVVFFGKGMKLSNNAMFLN